MEHLSIPPVFGKGRRHSVKCKSRTLVVDFHDTFERADTPNADTTQNELSFSWTATPLKGPVIPVRVLRHTPRSSRPRDCRLALCGEASETKQNVFQPIEPGRCWVWDVSLGASESCSRVVCPSRFLLTHGAVCLRSTRPNSVTRIKYR